MCYCDAIIIHTVNYDSKQIENKLKTLPTYLQLLASEREGK